MELQDIENMAIKAIQFILNQEKILNQISQKLKSSQNELAEKIPS